MGVHKKPGMNTARATVDCGPIFCEKEVSESTSLTLCSQQEQDRYESHCLASAFS